MVWVGREFKIPTESIRKALQECQCSLWVNPLPWGCEMPHLGLPGVLGKPHVLCRECSDSSNVHWCHQYCHSWMLWVSSADTNSKKPFCLFTTETAFTPQAGPYWPLSTWVQEMPWILGCFTTCKPPNPICNKLFKALRPQFSGSASVPASNYRDNFQQLGARAVFAMWISAYLIIPLKDDSVL